MSALYIDAVKRPLLLVAVSLSLAGCGEVVEGSSAGAQTSGDASDGTSTVVVPLTALHSSIQVSPAGGDDQVELGDISLNGNLGLTLNEGDGDDTLLLVD